MRKLGYAKSVIGKVGGAAMAAALMLPGTASALELSADQKRAIVAILTAPKGAPGSSIDNPSGFGANWGSVFFGVGGTHVPSDERGPDADSWDGSASVGFGLKPFKALGKFAPNIYSSLAEKAGISKDFIKGKLHQGKEFIKEKGSSFFGKIKEKLTSKTLFDQYGTPIISSRKDRKRDEKLQGYQKGSFGSRIKRDYSSSQGANLEKELTRLYALYDAKVIDKYEYDKRFREITKNGGMRSSSKDPRDSAEQKGGIKISKGGSFNLS